MNCLVTGGAGFIGSHLVDALLARGDAVTVLDDLSTGDRDRLRGALELGVELHAVDVRDPMAVEAVFRRAEPAVVFHLAAQVDVSTSVGSPGEDAATNIQGTIAVLEAARRTGTRRVVNSSSGGAVYGDAEVLPTPESHPVHPLSPYGQSKYAAEGYCELYRRLHGLSTVSLRYSNVYGPRQDASGEGGVVAIFCRVLEDGGRPTVFGDGKQTRDWVEVADVVRANLAAADLSVSGSFNVGSGRETSVLELIAALNELAPGSGLGEPMFAPERPGEVRRSLLAPSRAREQLGWQAEVGLREGLRRMLGLT
ncbi:MAG: GDP-mannose 4,6-dehydratase [Solirubrobacterales bacterium]|nr:GDP-mannose 4,6-dehydratase [Solirubrobacterales bacterium]